MKEPRVNYEHYDEQLRSAFRILETCGRKIPLPIVQELIHGWNCTWAIGGEYMQAMWEAALDCKGPILECGSGLSTVLLAIACRRTGNHVRSLEQKQWWAEHMKAELKKHRYAGQVTLEHSPLKVRGHYSWYTPDLKTMPKFKLVICDGPPGGTKGGRYGFLPVMRERLSHNCVIMLDDAGRPKERLALRAWEGELSVLAELHGTRKRYAVIRL